MDTPDDKRKPGRPKDTGRHQKTDALVLPRIADRKLRNTHEPLTTIIRELVDTERDTGAVRRLQRGFQARQDELMAAASQRREQQQWREIGEKFALVADGAHRLEIAFVEKLAAWERSPEGQQAKKVLDRIEQAMRSPEAQKWQALWAGRTLPPTFERNRR